ncbi:hypothetical protein CsSME_00030627 [Camellia sinensis var. sinensis]
MLTISNIIRCQRLTQSPVQLLIIRNWHKEPIPVAWEKPQVGWTKLNFDGVLRNHKAEFLFGYAQSIGKTTSTIAELAALRRGLELVIENGWNDVWLEGDSKTLVEIIAQKRLVKCTEAQRHMKKPQIWRNNPPFQVVPIMHEDAKGKISGGGNDNGSGSDKVVVAIVVG